MERPVEPFGVLLRRERVAAEMSLAQLAAAVHYDKGHLSKVETGTRRPSDAVLGTGGRLSVRVPDPPPAPAGAPGQAAEGDGTVWVMTLDAGGEGTFTTVGRRQVLSVGAASLLAWGLGRTAPDPARSVPAAAFEIVFTELRSLGRTAGPALVLPTLVCQIQVLRSLAVHAAGRQRANLVRLAARHMEFAGWMAQECGDDRAALWWTDRATEFAVAGQDHDLLAYTLVRRAGVALYRRDSAATVEFAQAARRSPFASVRTVGLAARRQAQGHALAGETDDCLRALDRSANLLADGELPFPGSPCGSTTALDQHALVTGWCLYDLGRTRTSADLLDQALSHAPATRAAVRFEVRRALAHAAGKEIDESCAIMDRVVDSAIAVDSATIRSDLRGLARAWGRWPTHPAIRRLAPRLEDAYRPERPVTA
jgi:hypothetical protein